MPVDRRLDVHGPSVIRTGAEGLAHWPQGRGFAERIKRDIGCPAEELGSGRRSAYLSVAVTHLGFHKRWLIPASCHHPAAQSRGAVRTSGRRMFDENEERDMKTKMLATAALVSMMAVGSAFAMDSPNKGSKEKERKKRTKIEKKI